MTSIESIKSKCKAWQKNDGTTRYYVNDWQEIIGLVVRQYKTGNIMSAALRDDDYEISNNHYNNYRLYDRQNTIGGCDSRYYNADGWGQ